MAEARYVRKLSTSEQQALRELYRATHEADVRTPQKVKRLKRLKKQAKHGELLLYFEDEIDLNLPPGDPALLDVEGQPTPAADAGRQPQTL